MKFLPKVGMKVLELSGKAPFCSPQFHILMRRFNKSDVIGVESVAEENLVDGAGEVGLGQEKG